MLNCDRCGLFSKGQSSICWDNNLKYEIISGYESTFDTLKILVNGEYENLAMLKEKFPWLQNIGPNVDNICDDCVFNMIHHKEATIQMQDFGGFRFCFYTSCCDKFIDNAGGKEDTKNYFRVEKENRFPYLSYYMIYNCMPSFLEDPRENEETKYISTEKSFFDYYEGCLICLECLEKQKLLTSIPTFKFNSPVFRSLKYLENDARCDISNSEEVLHKNSCTNEYTKNDYIKAYYMYISRRNNLEIKKELSVYFISRNLNIIRKYIFISKDIFSHILKFV